MTSTSDQTDRLLFKVEEAAKSLGLSRSKVYELIAEGHLPAVHIGRTTRVTKDALDSFVEQLSLDGCVRRTRRSTNSTATSPTKVV